jgi:two-component system, cell cycle response regulator DivK
MAHMSLENCQSPHKKRPTVLIADDDRGVRATYTRFLRSKGCDVVEVSNGREAVRKALRVQPDVIVMGLKIPQLDGWTATRWLRTFDSTYRTPVIALSTAPMTRLSAHAAGCDTFIAKPCLPEFLWWHVRTHCDRLLDSPLRITPRLGSNA